MDKEKLFIKREGTLLIKMNIQQNQDKKSMDRYVEKIPIKTDFFERTWEEEHKNFYPYSIKIYEKAPGI